MGPGRAVRAADDQEPAAFLLALAFLLDDHREDGLGSGLKLADRKRERLAVERDQGGERKALFFIQPGYAHLVLVGAEHESGGNGSELVGGQTGAAAKHHALGGVRDAGKSGRVLRPSRHETVNHCCDDTGGERVADNDDLQTAASTWRATRRGPVENSAGRGLGRK